MTPGAKRQESLRKRRKSAGLVEAPRAWVTPEVAEKIKTIIEAGKRKDEPIQD